MAQSRICLEFVNKIKHCEFLFVANWEILNQAIFHPLVNAIKFNKECGIVRITISVSDFNEQFATFSCEIRDSGSGISQQAKVNLFQSFNVSVDEMKSALSPNKQTYFSATSGVGLGLSTTKDLIELLDGEVLIDSEENVFTQITLNIKVDIKKTLHALPDDDEFTNMKSRRAHDATPKTGLLSQGQDGRLLSS